MPCPYGMPTAIGIHSVPPRSEPGYPDADVWPDSSDVLHVSWARHAVPLRCHKIRADLNQMTTPNQYDPEQHHRRSIRLKGYDYSWPGAYFITVCVHDKKCLLGKVVDGEMISNRYGRVVAECWRGIPAHFVGVTLDQWVIMPNHMHGIIMLATQPTYAVGARGMPCPWSMPPIRPTPRPNISLSPHDKSCCIARIPQACHLTAIRNKLHDVYQ
uniref:Transposase IS200-like domain-containing protein n=1 Tax=Candidatus Kentrum sp. DK TaxID=2126562 RepID=A0A450TEG3_9GAMM|nr:MAG: hypothetical protein BECKDK2373C_GA0170839_11297 [Candidatus Kentron sp. DK]